MHLAYSSAGIIFALPIRSRTGSAEISSSGAPFFIAASATSIELQDKSEKCVLLFQRRISILNGQRVLLEIVLAE